ncbi:MAG: hypothetical protein AAGB46_20060, partial [Verrucomicrobiota bacterium]
MITLIRSNCAVLKQGIDLLAQHSQETYTKADPRVFGSSIGAHARHVLDHYGSVIRGLDTGVVDYDARERSTSVEKDLEAGRAEFEKVFGVI